MTDDELDARVKAMSDADLEEINDLAFSKLRYLRPLAVTRRIARELFVLRRAIRKHRGSCQCPNNPNSADQELYAALEQESSS